MDDVWMSGTFDKSRTEAFVLEKEKKRRTMSNHIINQVFFFFFFLASITFSESDFGINIQSQVMRLHVHSTKCRFGRGQMRLVMKIFMLRNGIA